MKTRGQECLISSHTYTHSFMTFFRDLGLYQPLKLLSSEFSCLPMQSEVRIGRKPFKHLHRISCDTNLGYKNLP